MIKYQVKWNQINKCHLSIAWHIFVFKLLIKIWFNWLIKRKVKENHKFVAKLVNFKQKKFHFLLFFVLFTSQLTTSCLQSQYHQLSWHYDSHSIYKKLHNVCPLGSIRSTSLCSCFFDSYILGFPFLVIFSCFSTPHGQPRSNVYSIMCFRSWNMNNFVCMFFLVKSTRSTSLRI